MTSLVDSVQNIEHTFPNTDTQTYVTLASGTNVDNCVPFISWYGGTDYSDGQFFDVWLDDLGDDPRMYFQRTNSRSTSLYIKAAVVEFNSTKVKVHHGELPTIIGNDPETIVTTDEMFNREKSALKFYYRNTESSYYLTRSIPRGQLLTSSGTYGNEVSFKMAYTSGSFYGHYYIFESLDNDFEVGHYNTSSTIGMSVHFNTVDWHNTFLLSSYTTNTTTDDPDDCTFRAYLWGPNSVDINRSAAGYSSYVNTQVIEFNNDATISGARYCPKITNYPGMGTSTTELDGTLDIPVAFETSMMMPHQMPHRSTGARYSYNSDCFVAIWLTSSTSYKIKRNGSSSSCYPTTTCIDWAGTYPVYSGTGVDIDPIDPLRSPAKSVENFDIVIAEHVAHFSLSKGQIKSNCVPFITGFCDNTTNTGEQYRHEVRPYFYGDHLYVERGNDGNVYHGTVSLVEFYPDQVKVQNGDFIIDYNQSLVEVTIDPVNRARTFVMQYHVHSDGGYRWDYKLVKFSFVDDSTIQFKRGIAHDHSIVGAYYVVEALSDDLWDVYHYDTYLSTNTIAIKLDDSYNIYNTLNLISTYTTTTTDDADDATWRVYYHSPLHPARIDKQNSGYWSGVNAQIVKFLDKNLQRVHCTTVTATSTISEYTYGLPASWAGASNVTPVFCSLNHIARGDSSVASTITSLYPRLQHLPESNEVKLTRNGISSVTARCNIYSVNWEAVPKEIELKAYIKQNTYINSLETFNSTNSSRRVIFTPTKGQDLDNCVPFYNGKFGETTFDPEKFSKWIKFYKEQNSVHFESFWDTNENGGMDFNLSLIEFDPAQVKVQSGDINLMAGTNEITVSIDAVVTEKAFIIIYVLMSDGIGGQAGGLYLRTYFNSTTSFKINRAISPGHAMVSWFVVECLQDQWTVEHLASSSSTGTTFTLYPSEPRDPLYTIALSSMDNSATTDDPDDTGFRCYPQYNASGITSYVFNRQNAGHATVWNLSILSFNPRYDIKIVPFHFYVGSSRTTDVSLTHEVDVNRSIICTFTHLNGSRCNHSSGSGYQSMFFKAEFLDSKTVRISGVPYGTYDTWGHFYVLQLPLSSYEITGTVKEKGTAVVREVKLYDSETFQLVDEVVSASGTGEYSFYTTNSGSHYVVCLDDLEGTAYNGLIETGVFPTQVSGTFPYEEGWL